MKLFLLPCFCLIGLVLPTTVCADGWEKELIQSNAVIQTIENPESVFVQTDRSVYMVGEELWFSAFLYDLNKGKLNGSEQVLYLELCNHLGERILKNAYPLNQGRTQGNIQLPDDLEPGVYALWSYTNWMLNAGTEFLFQKPIVVLSDAQKSCCSSKSVKDSSSLGVSFFPEGGTMVAGLPVLVMAELTGSEEGEPVTGMLVDTHGEVLSVVNFDVAGRAVFRLTPAYGVDYRLQLTVNESLLSFTLPEVEGSGVTLGFEYAPGAAELALFLKAVFPGEESVPFFFVARQSGNVKAAFKGELQAGLNQFVLETAVFETGIVELAVFLNDGFPKARRLVYVQKADEPEVVVEELLVPNGVRSRGLLRVRVLDSTGEALEGDMTVSIVDANRVPELPHLDMDLPNYLKTLSDFCCDGPAGSSLAAADLDPLLFKLEAYRYHWDWLQNRQVILPKKLEEPGFYLSGTLYRSYPDKPLQGAEISMLVDGTREIFGAKTDLNGSFTFLLEDFEGPAKAVLQTKNANGRSKDYFMDLQSNLPLGLRFNSPKVYLGDQTRGIFPGLNFDYGDGVFMERGGLLMDHGFISESEIPVMNGEILIDEVLVQAEAKRSGGQKIREIYGKPESFLDQEGITRLMRDKPWQSSLFSLLYDELEGLEVGVLNSSVAFRLPGKRTPRFFLAVDGRFIGVTDNKGVLNDLLGVYERNDLMTFYAERVERIEFILPDDSIRASLVGQIAVFETPLFNTPGAESLEWAEQSMANDLSQIDLYSDPMAIISVHTVDGKGLYGKGSTVGATQLGIRGFSASSEYPLLDYGNTEVSSLVLRDDRNTLAWFPSLNFNSAEPARLSFYSSDKSSRYRIQINGITKDGRPFSKTMYLDIE